MHSDMFFSTDNERRGHGHGRGRDMRGHGHGPQGHRGGGMGPGMASGPFGERRGPGRGRRGDVRNTLLALVAEEPRNGYQLINAIAEATDGLWRPGAGSVYPALTLLTDEGLIEAVEDEGKKTYHLTADGKTWMAEHADDVAEPWKRVTEPHEGFLDVRKETMQLGLALQQVVMAGTPEQVKAARGIIDQARKDVYRLLAQD